MSSLYSQDPQTKRSKDFTETSVAWSFQQGILINGCYMVFAAWHVCSVFIHQNDVTRSYKRLGNKQVTTWYNLFKSYLQSAYPALIIFPFSSTTYRQNPKTGETWGQCVHFLCVLTNQYSLTGCLSFLSLSVCPIKIQSQKLSHWLVMTAWSQSGFSAEMSIMICVLWPLQDGWWEMRVPGERGEGGQGGGGSATLTSLLWAVGGWWWALHIAEYDRPHFAMRLGKPLHQDIFPN